MISKLSTSLLAIAVFFILLSISSFFYPDLRPNDKGVIKPDWAHPKGIRYNDLSKGDVLILSYGTSNNISVYLLSVEQANEYRSPRFYKEELPGPICSGKEGKVEIEIVDDGDYEILFLGNNITRDNSIRWEVERKLRKDRVLSFIMMITFILIAILFIFFGIRAGKGPSKTVNVDVHRDS